MALRLRARRLRRPIRLPARAAPALQPAPPAPHPPPEARRRAGAPAAGRQWRWEADDACRRLREGGTRGHGADADGPDYARGALTAAGRARASAPLQPAGRIDGLAVAAQLEVQRRLPLAARVAYARHRVAARDPVAHFAQQGVLVGVQAHGGVAGVD